MSNSYALHCTEGDLTRVATILPGRRYTAEGPLLYHARAALRGLGWTVRVVEWTAPPSLDTARESATRVLDGPDAPDDATTHLVVAKSLGTVAMPLAAKLQLPGVWLTPLLTVADAPEIRGAATGLAEDHLMIGGGADPTWDHDFVAGLGTDYVEVADANHALEVPDDWRRNLETVEDLTAEIEYFAASFDAR
ncbi:hypothetical protein [Myceligenerans crystallogenes]|uniref:Alpha/beta hydrolase n=1 Tax=Myceligenerans crystallogenes TaxID=316335 RepID=A0ABN2NCH1_9MICO